MNVSTTRKPRSTQIHECDNVGLIYPPCWTQTLQWTKRQHTNRVITIDGESVLPENNYTMKVKIKHLQGYFDVDNQPPVHRSPLYQSNLSSHVVESLVWLARKRRGPPFLAHFDCPARKLSTLCLWSRESCWLYQNGGASHKQSQWSVDVSLVWHNYVASASFLHALVVRSLDFVFQASILFYRISNACVTHVGYVSNPTHLSSWWLMVVQTLGTVVWSSKITQ